MDLTNLTNGQGDTLLHMAARSESTSSVSIMKLLLQREPQLLEIENGDMRTPLHSAAFGKYLLFTEEFIENCQRCPAHLPTSTKNSCQPYLYFVDMDMNIFMTVPR